MAADRIVLEEARLPLTLNLEQQPWHSLHQLCQCLDFLPLLANIGYSETTSARTFKIVFLQEKSGNSYSILVAYIPSTTTDADEIAALAYSIRPISK